MILEEFQKEQIKKQSLDNPTEEICGLLVLDRSHQLNIVSCRNSSPCPAEHFVLDSRDYIDAAENGKIIGVYHSHCNGNNFSELDKINAGGHNLISIIYDIKSDSFKEYHPKNYISPYVGREWKLKEKDCFVLVMDYYKNELNIDLGGYFSDIDYAAVKENGLYDETCNKHGFIKVIEGKIDGSNIDKLKAHDILFFKYDNNIHVALYIGAGFILHHVKDEYSSIQPFSPAYQRRIGFVARHKSFN